MDFSKENLFYVPIWIKMPGLEFKYWSAKSLREIGSPVGKPLMVDKNTKQNMGLSFAKLLAEVQIGKALPDNVHFKNDKGQIIEQQFTYDWKIIINDKCQKYGHRNEVCRKNKEKEVNVTNIDPNVGGAKVERKPNQSPISSQVVVVKKSDGTQTIERGQATGKQPLAL